MEERMYIHMFLALALFGDEWSATRHCRFTPGEKVPCSYWIGGWVDPRTGLDDVKTKFLILPGLEFRPLDRSAHSQWLYQLRYPGFELSTFLVQIRILTAYFSITDL
jgi:hypothetical protein